MIEIETSKLTIKIDGKEIMLSLKQAQELRRVLDNMFEDKDVHEVELIPLPFPLYPLPPFPPYGGTVVTDYANSETIGTEDWDTP